MLCSTDDYTNDRTTSEDGGQENESPEPRTLITHGQESAEEAAVTVDRQYSAPLSHSHTLHLFLFLCVCVCVRISLCLRLSLSESLSASLSVYEPHSRA